MAPAPAANKCPEETRMFVVGAIRRCLRSQISCTTMGSFVMGSQHANDLGSSAACLPSCFSMSGEELCNATGVEVLQTDKRQLPSSMCGTHKISMKMCLIPQMCSAHTVIVTAVIQWIGDEHVHLCVCVAPGGRGFKFLHCSRIMVIRSR